MNKILLLGNTGQLGWELNRTLLTLGEITALDYPDIDMANPDDIRSTVRTAQPDIIVNATAYTNVDQAESERDLAMAINATGPGILAEEAKKCGAALIHYSTDYVFDGTKGAPYTEADQPKPLNVYGESKLAGEQAVQAAGGAYLIFRTSWVYSLRRPCFVTKVLQWARENETLRIVDDQVSTPTWARTLAEATAQIVALGDSDSFKGIQARTGIYHLTDGGHCSRYDWSKFIIEHAQTPLNVKEIFAAKSDEFITPANRPQHSILDVTKIADSFNIHLGGWQLPQMIALQNHSSGS